MRTRKSLEQQISSLPKIDRPALSDLYKRLYSKSPSPRHLREHIELAVALKLQKQLTAKLRAKMMRVLAATEAITSILITDSRHTELVREWKGRIYSVTILDDCVMYKDQRYRSLSAAAYAITGKRCSGSVFFGLKSNEKKKVVAHAQ